MTKAHIQAAQAKVTDMQDKASALANDLNQIGQTKLANDAQAIYGDGVNAQSSLGDAVTTCEAAAEACQTAIDNLAGAPS